MAGYQIPKLEEKSSSMKCYPNLKRHELLEDAREFALADPGRGWGDWGAYARPLFVYFLVFFFIIAKFTSKKLVLNE